MNGRAPSDLVVQMRILIAEEAFLWQLCEEVTDYHGAAKTVVRGPWQTADCRQILMRWFDCGLIDCVAAAQATKVQPDEVVNQDAYLTVDSETAAGETATVRSLKTSSSSSNPDKIEQGLSLSVGRHRFWRPGCGAQRYLVVTPKPAEPPSAQSQVR